MPPFDRSAVSSESVAETAASVVREIKGDGTSEQNDGAHLHLELVGANGEFVNPMNKLPEGTEQ